MLVDGCLIDNVPLASMHQLKSGPNLVVHFGEPAAEMFEMRRVTVGSGAVEIQRNIIAKRVLGLTS